MTRIPQLILAAAATMTVGFSAGAATLTFESASDCTTPGVNLTAGYADTSAGACDLQPGPGGSSSLYRGADQVPGDSFWTVRLDDLASFISVDLGDFGEDFDQLFLWAYDSSNTIVGEAYFSNFSYFDNMHTLSVDAGANVVAWFTFGTFQTRFSTGIGIYADNLTINSLPSAVPLPAAGGMLALGLAGLGLLRRRKSAA